MKLIAVFLILATSLHAKTWIELAKEADYHADHPGSEITDPEDHPQRLDYLELNVRTLEKIIMGESGILPHTPPLFDSNDWSASFFMAQMKLRQFIRIQIKLQKWKSVDQLLNLAHRIRQKVHSSEPNLVVFLTASASAQTCFQSLETLKQVKDDSERRRVFHMLRNHWNQTHNARAKFLLSQKGETRFAIEYAKDPKAMIQSAQANLDEPSFFLDIDFPLKLSTRELLDLSVKPDLIKKDSLDDLKAHYQWIRSGKPIDQFLKARPKRVPRPLAFYQNHPNGLGELMKDGMVGPGIAPIVSSIMTMTLLHEVAWCLLEQEAKGISIQNQTQLIELLPEKVREDFTAFKFKINVSQRVVIAPDSPLLGESELQQTVPNLFPN